MISAEEFFAEYDTDSETDKSETDESEDETDEAEDDDKEKKLEESLKSYRRANHRLFHD